jgi:hypothetical protein
MAFHPNEVPSIASICAGLGFFRKKGLASANNSAAATPAGKSKKQTDYNKGNQDIVIEIPAQEC